MVTTGDLRAKIQFERQATKDDGAGIKRGDWEPQFVRHANVHPLAGSEPVMGQRLAGIQPVLITIRFDNEAATIDPSWRAVELRDSDIVQIYALKSVENMDRKRRWLTILAEKGAADA